MYSQAEALNISLHQAVIIASMIEAEAANNDERANIASVIYNRLEQGMPLQIDATVMYALGEHKEHLTEEDLKVESPYNTYTNTGLPAGPICNPGLASINAALNPASTSYLYYALDTETGKFFTNTTTSRPSPPPRTTLRVERQRVVAARPRLYPDTKAAASFGTGGCGPPLTRKRTSPATAGAARSAMNVPVRACGKGSI